MTEPGNDGSEHTEGCRKSDETLSQVLVFDINADALSAR